MALAKVSTIPRNKNGEKRTFTHLIIGKPRDVREPGIFHSLSLVAFLAWVGLGSDGLSSSCYGPEEAFLALGHHQYLAVFLALMTAITVFVIATSYSQTIDLFPTGGGGYLVATTLLGPYPGVISGCALVIDYVLTISISIASGADAIFSFLPVAWAPWKLLVCAAVVFLMVVMNLRGVKESVLSLLPIFIAFIIMHVLLVGYALVSHGAELPNVFRVAAHEAHASATMLGWFVLLAIFFRAYSMGGGTYTGIEAVSNGLPILREPRTVTGKRTMVYMAISLAFIAGGILLAYLLENVEPETGKTLNAVLFERVASKWAMGGTIITFALITEGALLFVAAQTGFIDGPRVLATMAHDRWLPRRFSYLSTRLVTQDGVLAMGLAAGAVLVGTRASVDLLVVLYAINVFVTFTLSQLGMSTHWWTERKTERGWKRKLLVNGIGCTFTLMILLITLALKFNQGGWVTILITTALVVLCFVVRGHYDRVARAVQQLEADILPRLYSAKAVEPGLRDAEAPTAVMLVSGFNGLGLATLLQLEELFPKQFRNIVFVGVGEVDSSQMRSHEQIEALESRMADDLGSYCDLAQQLGFHAEHRSGLGPDVVLELRVACSEVMTTFSRCVFFAGSLIFEDESEGLIERFLHNHTAYEIQRWLQVQGRSLVILPICVSLRASAQASPPGKKRLSIAGNDLPNPPRQLSSR
ncbi:MAG TPA: APC family permease [Candidatus Binataceae bacterium]|nr:APC family permease [Candidatus Binataceae bacterium]